MRRPAWTILLTITLGACDLASDAGGAPLLNSPATLEIVGGNDQSATVGTKLPAAIIVRVSDSRKEGIVGVNVTFEVTLGEGTLSGTTVKTASDGTAQVDWTLGPEAGAQQLEARVVEPSTGRVLLSARINATASAR